MTCEKPFPTSPRRVLLYMIDHGTGTRPADTEHSDRIELDYPDPLKLKGERSALASIYATRAYMWTKKNIKNQEDTLSQPSSTTMSSMGELQGKFDRIGSAFMEAMYRGLRRDERIIALLPEEDITRENYLRLKDLLQPVTTHGPAGNRKIKSAFGFVRIYNREESVFNDLFGGVEPLPTHIYILIQHAYEHFIERFDQEPSVSTVLQIIRNSYDSYIKVNYKRHNLELHNLSEYELDAVQNETTYVTELKGETDEDFHIAFKPEIEEVVSTLELEKEGSISDKATCAFSMPTKYTKEYLGGVPDFADPMRDSFDLLVNLLAA